MARIVNAHGIGEKIDFRPETVDLHVTAGDSISVNLHVDQISNMPNALFTGQVRDDFGDSVQEFTITPLPTGASFFLTADQTRELSELPWRPKQRVVLAGAPQVLWQGVYDMQVGHDPNVVRTLVSGRIFIEEDVTRNG